MIKNILQQKHKIISNHFILLNSYGKGYNKADSFPRTGRKQQLVEQMVKIFFIKNSICNKSHNKLMKNNRENSNKLVEVYSQLPIGKHSFPNH